MKEHKKYIHIEQISKELPSAVTLKLAKEIVIRRMKNE